MRVGWVGLGRLGYPCALTLAKYGGHTVTGYDPRPPKLPAYEAGADQLDETAITLARSAADVVAASDVVFVAVQTPHAPAYGGETPAPAERRDFEYGYLVNAVRDVFAACRTQNRTVTVVVVSTVLPGTTNRLLRPMRPPNARLVYSPLFIAMGTTVADFLAPEFVLAGADDPADVEPVKQVYAALHNRPVVETTIETAELVKVAYNTIISAKVVAGNALMEICEKTGADCDQVVDALALATDRVISPKYLRGGMGDGGQCHPRDLIAMSWLAERLDLSYDLLGEMARAREAQTGWLADLTVRWAEQTGLDVCVLGTAYKPGVPLQQGSPALLLADLLEDRVPGRMVALHDPYADPEPGHAERLMADPRVFVVGCKHPEFAGYGFPAGSVVLDPHGYIPDRPGVTVIRIGRKS